MENKSAKKVSIKAPSVESNSDDNKENGPLSSHRDPRRTPLVSRIPFTPTPGGTNGGRRRKEITPAYAYKNAETGLLEIRTVIPPSLSIVANEDDTVVGVDADEKLCNTKLALYPIALNGGGAGLYCDPRAYANGTAGGFSNNHNIAGTCRAPLMSHVRFAWPNENKNNARLQPLNRDLEMGLSHPPYGVEDDEMTHRTRHSVGTLASAMNPWRIWENVHNEMSRLAAIRAKYLEDEASHVTLARQRNKVSRVSSVYNDDDFDFALVLTPNDAYAFWAMHLDFIEEAQHLVYDQEPDVNDVDVHDDDSTIATATCQGAKVQENPHALKASATPKTPNDGSGLRRRKNATPRLGSNSINQFSASKKTPSSTGRYPSHRSPFRAPRTSERVFSQRKSVFERALDRLTPPSLSQRRLSINNEKKKEDTPSSDNIKSPSPCIQRRRWGNGYDAHKLSTPNLTSPPIVSLKKGGKKGMSIQKKGQGGPLRDGTERRVDGEGQSSTRSSTKRVRDDDDVDGIYDKDDKFFSSPGLPRGIAARVNGLEQFLEALKIGVVVRRHWPRGRSVFVLLSSDNGGDSIQFKFIPDEEAVIALKEQAQRYDRFRRQKKARLNSGELESRRMSRDSENNSTQITDKHESSVPLPDYVKAKIDREEVIRKNGVFRHAIANETLKWQNSCTLEAKDIVQVQPATHLDPFSKEVEKFGTASLRLSNTEYVKHTTLSVIVPSIQGKLIRDYSRMDLTTKWCDGEHQSLFSSLDIEMATEGEYWMMLKGFILLHRDASTGRFAAQRACGFGNYHRHADVRPESAADCDKKKFTESLPLPKTMLQRLFGMNDDEQAEAVQQITSVPPSDYFLGFSSPGTQIWGRLRQAGLETQRLYSLDTRKVMIKVRCPVDRLQDVAEALKLKMKTKDGDFAPFREDMISQFASTDDGFVSCEDDVKKLVSLFRSSERQKIINFIIGSRIRDSGAELGPSTQLGKKIQRRVPLHSHARLEALYTHWVLYWRRSNWNDPDTKMVGTAKSSHKRMTSNASSEGGQTRSNPLSATSPTATTKIPNILYRFFVGSFYLPLDSIEEYYGEKVAFYFAWLQHCSFHLLYLSVAGLVMFIIQVTSGNWDHPLRPWFSILVMIWSFVVMVTWRRQSNFLAYQWGTLDYQEEEVARPEFKGTRYDVCPVTNTWVPYYPPWKRWLKMCISIPLTIGFTMATLLGILILYGNRDAMLQNYFSSDERGTYQFRFSWDVIGSAKPIQTVALSTANLSDPRFWLIMTGFPSLLGLILPLLNFCLRQLSLWLNEIENHRTEAEHQTHFIIKVFAFRFVCYFAALYYYSFLGSTTDDTHATEHGIIRVASSLVVYLTIAHWWSICLQVFFPLLLYRWRVFRERLRLRNEFRSLEMMELDLAQSHEQERTADERLELKKTLLNKRLLLEHAQVNIWEEMMLPEHDTFTEYLFAVTHFAYVACFSVILPITPLIVLINHLVNMRLDAFKICRARCRPLSQKTGGIGVWNHVLHIVTVIAILTNCSLMALTSSVFNPLVQNPNIGTLGVFALAIGWEHLMLLLKYIMQLTVSTVPSDVKNLIKKKKFDQERTRYTTLRAKKDRRSGSAGMALPPPLDDDNCKTDKSSLHFKASPCPPIRESVAESYTHISPEVKAEVSPVILQKPNEEAPTAKPHGRALVNVRTTKRHSQRQEQTNPGSQYLSGSAQKQPSSTSVGILSGKISSRTIANSDENDDPNVDEAISDHQRQPYSTTKSPYRAGYNSSHTSAFGDVMHSNRRIDSTNPVSEPKANEVWRSFQQQRQTHHQEDIISPSSSISTIPAMLTPCQLNLDDDEDDTLQTIEAGRTPSGLYQGASAPPLSPPSNHGYVSRSNTSGLVSNTSGLVFMDDDDDDHSGPKAKWGVHHFLQYAKSEKSLSMSEQKKSR